MNPDSSFLSGRFMPGNFLKFSGAVWLLAGLVAFAAMQRASAQSYVLTKGWYVTNGVAHLSNTGNNRGVAYNVNSNQVFVATRTAAATGFIDVFDGTTGSLLSGSGGIAGANLGIDQVGVGDDGTLYAVPLNTGLTTATGNLTVYAWTNWSLNATPYAAYSSASSDAAVANFSGKRIGDTMAVTGAGTNTLILLGIGAQGTNFILLHTADGLNFTPTAVLIPNGLPSTAGNIFGITFYTNGTFLVLAGANASSHNIFLCSYPANFASQSSVTGTVLGNAGTLTANLTAAINYSPAGQMLAVVQTASASVNTNAIFSLTNFPGNATQLASVNFATPNSNGNATGGAALGGLGKTNYLYVLQSNNGLQAYQINFATVFPPSISTAPAGISGTFPAYNLSVAATGTQPLSYQWLASNSRTNIAGTFTNIFNATNTVYSVNYAATNYFEVIITNAYGAITSSPVAVSLLTPVLSTVVTQQLTIPAGTYSYLAASGDASRGLGYDTNSQRLVLSSTVGGSGLYILDANTGTNLGTLSLSGISFGGLLGGVDQVAIGDDGVVYAGNLVSGSGFTLFSWPAPTNGAVGQQIYQDNAGPLTTGDRWGDTISIRGAGASTQILFGSRSGTNVALLSANGGGGFNANVIAITNAPAGFAQNGIAFGAGNTFWAKAYLGHLYEVAYDPVGLVGGVILDYPNPTKIPSSQIGVAVDPANNIMAGIDESDSPHDVKLYQLTGTSDAPVLFNQSFFGSAAANGNANVAMVMKYPRLYALDVNNGIIGLTYGVPPTTPPTITVSPASVTAYANVSSVTFSVSASGSVPLFYQWRLNSNDIAGAIASTYTITNPPLNTAGYYDVVVHNIAGAVTSTPPALLSLTTPILNTVVTQLWTLPVGSQPFLDGSSYNTRGMAYDPNTGMVLLADHNNIYLLSATNGSLLGQLNMLGLPSGGLNGWVVDQIGVADDGVLYSCNLTLAGAGFAIVQWTSLAPNAPGTAYAYGGSSGADPGNGSGDRWGDTMSVRGAGVHTEILVGSYSSHNVVLFTTADGTTFTPTLITVTNLPDDATAPFSSGIAFGAGNTFWAKGGHNYDLREVAYNPATGSGTVIQDFAAGTEVPNDLPGISVDVTNNILAGVSLNDSPDDMQLYLLSGNPTPPALFNQAFFASANPNSQDNAVTVLKGGMGFGLDVNNGLVAVSYGVPTAPATMLTSVSYAPGNVVINWSNIFNGHGYQVQYKNSLLDQTWTNLGSPVTTNAPTASFSDTTATGTARFYRVVSE